MPIYRPDTRNDMKKKDSHPQTCIILLYKTKLPKLLFSNKCVLRIGFWLVSVIAMKAFISKVITFENRNTVFKFGLLNSYNAHLCSFFYFVCSNVSYFHDTDPMFLMYFVIFSPICPAKKTHVSIKATYILLLMYATSHECLTTIPHLSRNYGLNSFNFVLMNSVTKVIRSINEPGFRY
jgi:hypothetical protein